MTLSLSLSLSLSMVVLCALAVSCGGEQGAGAGSDGGTLGAEGGVPVGFPSAMDFAGFRAWPRVSLGDLSAGGHPEGPVQYAYLNHPRPTGARVFATGTVIVRTLETGDPTAWEIFAMARRGGGYNAGGDVNWEFFRLRIAPQGEVDILARGTDPRLATDDGYALGDGVGCNACHGAADARTYDGVLSPALRPPDP